MNDALLVTVLNSVDDLPEFVPRVWLSQSTIPSDEVCTATITDFTTQPFSRYVCYSRFGLNAAFYVWVRVIVQLCRDNVP